LRSLPGVQRVSLRVAGLRHRPDAWIAILGFAAFCTVVLFRAAALLEPDDYAYRASIVALGHGHIILSNAQYLVLNHQLGGSGGSGILQWHHLASGKWISEKNPGYPFLAVVFYVVGLLRVAPLFYGALAAVGLFLGARAWLGRWAGTYAVLIYLFSGAALTFAWRSTMPSFSDASLIAAAVGGLLWVVLRVDVNVRRRLGVGLACFVALEAAVFIRYTDAVVIVVALLAVAIVRRRVQLPWSAVIAWTSSVALFGLGVLAFDSWAYGSATSTGYSTGEISFSPSSFYPNLRGMPAHLTRSMPVWLLAAVAVAWIVVRLIRSRHHGDSDSRQLVRRDAVVAAALTAGWLSIWLLYLNYTWTVSQLGGHGPGPGGGAITVHLIRFYLPALGMIALLGAWVLSRIPRSAAWLAVAALVAASIFSFQSMSANSGGGSPGAIPGAGSTGNQRPQPPGPGFPGAGPPGGSQPTAVPSIPHAGATSTPRG